LSRTIVVVALAGALALSMLTGCASETERYCGSLEDNKQELKDLADSAQKQDDDLFGRSLEVFEELRSGAPGDLVDEWDTLIFAMEGLDAALDEAGVSAGELRSGEKPDGVSEEQMAAIEAAAQDLGSEEVAAAGDGIEQQALDVCKVDLTF